MDKEGVFFGDSQPLSGPQSSCLPTSRFKQLLLTQADKFSPAEVRRSGLVDTCPQVLPTGH